MGIEQHDRLLHGDDRPLGGLLDAIAGIRRHLWLVLVCALIVPVVALAYALHGQRMYTAHAALLFTDPGVADQLLATSAPATPASVDPAVTQATNNQLVNLPAVAAYSSAALHGRLTPSEVSSDVSVSSSGQSNVSTVAASNPDRGLAALLANTYAQQFIAFRRAADRARVGSALALVGQEIAALPAAAVAQRVALQRYVGELQVLEALQTGDAEVVQDAAVPLSPSSTSPTRHAVLGLGLGLLLGIGLALLFDRLDRSLKDPDEVANAFSRPILTSVPESRALSRARGSGL